MGRPVLKEVRRLFPFIERVFGWLGRCRRLAKDFENALAFRRVALIGSFADDAIWPLFPITGGKKECPSRLRGKGLACCFMILRLENQLTVVSPPTPKTKSDKRAPSCQVGEAAG